MFQQLVSLPRRYKLLLMLANDVFAIPFAFWLAFNLRLDFEHLILSPLEWGAVFFITGLTIACFAKLGLYRTVVRYIGMDAGWAVFKGAAFSALVLILISFSTRMFVPRSVPFIYFILLLVICGGSRFFARQLIQSSRRKKRRLVAIYGAGAAGTQAAMSLMSSPEYRPVMFIDDDSTIQGRVIHGVSVVSPRVFAKRVEMKQVSDVLLAIPSVSGARRREIIGSISQLPVHVHTIPGMADLVSGKARIEEFREVDIEELLGRDSILPDEDLMQANIRGKVVLVTGAGGSIGSELCRQIIRLQPSVLVLFEQSEFALYRIERELALAASGLLHEFTLHPVLGSVLDKKLLESMFCSFGVQTVYHAAAYKHVPLVESNVVAGVHNNLFGTLNMAEIAEHCGVETCVLVSTDKAVRPTNVMGASKRLAELVFQAMHSRNSKTCFSMVRFGNVLGSSGSVIPLFREQIARGGPVTVTHPDIIRYFMTIPEAAQLVIQAGAMARGGEVFVLDMGEPVNIADLARKMIGLMGLTVDEGGGEGDIEITFSGLRPGEKLFEELLIGDNVTPTRHPRVSQAQEFSLPWEELSCSIERLRVLCDVGESEKIRDYLIRLPIAYTEQRMATETIPVP